MPPDPRDPTPEQDSLPARLRRALAGRAPRLGLLLALFVAYALVLVPLRERLGLAAALLGVTPMVLGGLLFGKRGGLVAGLALPVLNILMLELAGQPGWTTVIVDTRGLGPLTSVALGLTVGHMRDLAQALGRQVAEQQRTRMALDESRQLLESAFRDAAIGMALVAPDGRWLQVNPALCALVGYSAPELLATTFQAITHPDDLETDLDYVRQMLAGAIPTYQLDKRYFHKAGHIVWIQLNVSLARASDGQPLYFLAQIQDITDRKRAEAQLQHAAFHDALTGLPNRALFLDRLRHALERRRRHPDFTFAVLFLDFDRFKVVNDSLGHSMGDQLLIAGAQRLAACVRGLDTVARLGGDEFCILLEDVRALAAATEVADRIQRALQQPFELGGHRLAAPASIGIVLSGAGADRPEDILRDADAAMYRAKALGKARYEVFQEEMRVEAMARLLVETDLRRALERDEFELFYQPIVVFATGQVTGLEALLRWQHPERGLLSPGEFLSTAEETGLIVPIGQWVLRQACRQLGAWQARFARRPPLSVSVNLSSRQMAQPDLDLFIGQLLTEHRLAPGSLRLEITEHAIVDETPAAAGLLARLKEFGVRLEIDDFGTGYSALSYLQRLELDALKIDRSFVQQLGADASRGAVVRTILALGQSLNLQVIAEGVETEEQLARLQALGCANGQGYLFGRPMAAEAVERRLGE
jgi:diguanylate cyclase (GGDEF)-like protein/PAS domain S-box-containing protein